MRTCDAAVEILRETKNLAVMWGDEGLLHLIAERAKIKTARRAWKTSDRVLANLSRQPGILVKGLTTLGNGHVVRIFHLPEVAS